MHPSLPTSPLLNATKTPSGNHSNQGKNHEYHSPRFVKTQHPRDPGPRTIRKKSSYSPTIKRKYLHLMTTPWIQKSKGNLQHKPNTRKNLQAFTLSELKQVIKQLNPLKAPGSDLITAHMIQEMPPKGLQTLLYIFNVITRLGYWPVPLKHAKIIMIPKPGKNPTDVISYRPISLLPVISKILEKILLKRYTMTHNSRRGYPCINSASEKRILLYNNATVLQI